MSTREQDVLRRVGEASVLVLISLASGPKHGYAARAAGTTQSPSGPIPQKVKPTPPGAGSSSPRQVTPCRPVLPRHVTGAILAASHSQLSIQGTAHARSC